MHHFLDKNETLVPDIDVQTMNGVLQMFKDNLGIRHDQTICDHNYSFLACNGTNYHLGI